MQQELGTISNTCYSKANKNSFYNKQKVQFEKNMQEYHASAKNAHVHKHVIEITEMFRHLANPPTNKGKNHLRSFYLLFSFYVNAKKFILGSRKLRNINMIRKFSILLATASKNPSPFACL